MRTANATRRGTQAHSPALIGLGGERREERAPFVYADGLEHRRLAGAVASFADERYVIANEDPREGMICGRRCDESEHRINM